MYINFPSNFIYIEKVKNHNEIKEIYLSKIKNSIASLTKKDAWNCEVTTSMFNETINYDIFDKYFYDSVVWKYFDKLLEEKPYPFETPIESKILDIWYNVYSPGQYQEVHNHADGMAIRGKTNFGVSMFSGIYIMDLHEKNTTGFYQQGPIPCQKYNYGITVFPENTEEGSIMIFPSGLSHFVSPVKKTRTTVAFNLLSFFGQS
jgi:hypothetical protein